MRRFLMTLVLFAGAIFLLRRLAGTLGGTRGTGDGAAPGQATPRGPSRSKKLVRDPLCLTYLPADSALPLEGAGSAGETLWFCSDRCRSGWQSSRRAAS